MGKTVKNNLFLSFLQEFILGGIYLFLGRHRPEQQGQRTKPAASSRHTSASPEPGAARTTQIENASDHDLTPQCVQRSDRL